MPRYSYVAKNKDAKTIKDIEDAGSREELVGRLKSRGLFIISIDEAISVREKSILSFFKRKARRSSIRLSDLTFLARNLSTTLSSGVTLLRSLEIISSQTESLKLSKILHKCSEDIRSGAAFKDAIAKYPNVFSQLWRAIIEVGETSGNLAPVLEKLADYLAMRMDFERKIITALIYPVILLIGSLIALLTFFKLILPKFIEVFNQFNIDLPLPTKILFSIASFIDKNFIFVLIMLVGLTIGLILFFTRNEARQVRDKIILKLPLLGELIFFFCLDRFTTTMYMLLDSGLPLVYALDIAAHSSGNVMLEKNITFVKNRVKDGASLSREISKLNIFPALIAEMTKIGEETGTMPDIFKKISEHYNRELTTRVERLVAAFEPLMILVMGVLIGGMVISLFLPIFQLSTMSKI